MNFEKYLQKKKLTQSTIKGNLNNLERFKKWSEKENINDRNVNYNHLLKFIQQAQQRGVSKSSINIHLNSISKYYDYLVIQGERKDNPAKELRLKNNGKRVLKNLLTTQELEEIYTSHISKPEWSFTKGEKSKQTHQRNAAILGLIIYQAIQTPELKKIEKRHINLLQGTVYIPSAGRSNSRILQLNARQIIPMQQYLKSIEKEQEKLFNCNISAAMMWLMKTLNKTNEKTRDAKQIRSSVIMNWLKQYNIRQVQYMAGHRYISSTEKYKQEDLQDLQTALNLFHPLK
jgi:integrase/recombinase XerD